MKKPPMSIVAVKNKYQVVIPQRLREELGINRGDLLEAKVERGKLTYTPKAVLDRKIPTGKAEREQFFQQLRAEAPEWLKGMWADSKRRGTDKLTMRQIDAEIAAARRERTSKKNIKSPAR
jgi:AbrB family looped-hinge helix DNA binding protein